MASPAAASLGIADLLRGTPLPGLIRGTTSGGGWLDLGGHIVVLGGPDGPRLPNEISVRALTLPEHDPHCVAGGGSLRIGEIAIDVVRWWDPRPSLPPFDVEGLARRTRDAARMLACPDYCGLVEALRDGDPVAMRAGARELLGRGQGLTPEGDDVLIGLLAALALLGPAIDADRASLALKALAPVVEIEAPFRTSDLSTSLLRHAAAGETAAALGALIRWLAGRGELETALTGLREVGATSGIAMGCGALVTAAGLTEGVDR